MHSMLHAAARVCICARIYVFNKCSLYMKNGDWCLANWIYNIIMRLHPLDWRGDGCVSISRRLVTPWPMQLSHSSQKPFKFKIINKNFKKYFKLPFSKQKNIGQQINETNRFHPTTTTTTTKIIWENLYYSNFFQLLLHQFINCLFLLFFFLFLQHNLSKNKRRKPKVNTTNFLCSHQARLKRCQYDIT